MIDIYFLALMSVCFILLSIVIHHENKKWIKTERQRRLLIGKRLEQVKLSNQKMVGLMSSGTTKNQKES